MLHVKSPGPRSLWALVHGCLAAAGLLDGFRRGESVGRTPLLLPRTTRPCDRSRRALSSSKFEAALQQAAQAAVVDLMLDLIAPGMAAARSPSTFRTCSSTTRGLGARDQAGRPRPVTRRACPATGEGGCPRCATMSKKRAEPRRYQSDGGGRLAAQRSARLFEHEFCVGRPVLSEHLPRAWRAALAEETRLGAKDVAARTGFASAAALWRAFTRRCGADLARRARQSARRRPALDDVFREPDCRSGFG